MMSREVGREDIVIGKYLKMKRVKNNLSQKDIAKYLKVTFQQIQKYEAGINRLSLTNAIRLSNYIDFKLEEVSNIVEYKMND